MNATLVCLKFIVLILKLLFAIIYHLNRAFAEAHLRTRTAFSFQPLDVSTYYGDKTFGTYCHNKYSFLLNQVTPVKWFCSFLKSGSDIISHSFSFIYWQNLTELERWNEVSRKKVWTFPDTILPLTVDISLNGKLFNKNLMMSIIKYALQ